MVVGEPQLARPPSWRATAKRAALIWEGEIVVAALTFALSRGTPHAEEHGHTDKPANQATVSVFTVSPIESDQIREVIALGNLDPTGGHVFPTDHIYLDYGREPGLRVRAPAAGKVRSIRDQLVGDVKIEIQVDQNVSYYLAHLELEPGIAVGSKVSAGQELGRASAKSMLDLGACDARVRLPGLVNPDRYPQPTLQTIPPLTLFSEPLRTRLYAKVLREGSDKDGKIDWDKPGRLVGNWFHESLSVAESSRAESQTWAKQLSFAYDVREPKAVRISIGGTIAPAGLYGLPEGARDPAEVGPETGLVKYPLRRIEPGALGRGRSQGRFGQNSGLLLVQLMSGRQLKVEYFADGSAADVKDFSDKASIYER